MQPCTQFPPLTLFTRQCLKTCGHTIGGANQPEADTEIPKFPFSIVIPRNSPRPAVREADTRQPSLPSAGLPAGAVAVTLSQPGLEPTLASSRTLDAHAQAAPAPEPIAVQKAAARLTTAPQQQTATQGSSGSLALPADDAQEQALGSTAEETLMSKDLRHHESEPGLLLTAVPQPATQQPQQASALGPSSDAAADSIQHLLAASTEEAQMQPAPGQQDPSASCCILASLQPEKRRHSALMEESHVEHQKDQAELPALSEQLIAKKAKTLNQIIELPD